MHLITCTSLNFKEKGSKPFNHLIMLCLCFHIYNSFYIYSQMKNIVTWFLWIKKESVKKYMFALKLFCNVFFPSSLSKNICVRKYVWKGGGGLSNFFYILSIPINVSSCIQSVKSKQFPRLWTCISQQLKGIRLLASLNAVGRQ